MRNFVFDAPYWFLGLLAVAAVILWINGNSRRAPRLRLAAYTVLLLGVALFAVSQLFETDREIVIRRTRQLADAVEKRDKSIPQKLLAPDAEFIGLTKPQIIDRLASAADQFHLKSIRISSIEVTPQGKDLSALVSATADMELGGWGGGTASTWELVWEKTPGGWLLRELRPISVFNMDVRALEQRLKSGY